MRFYKSLIAILFVVFVSVACNRPPDLSPIPSISYHKVDFNITNEGDPLLQSTVLTLSINVEDGDGDLGLSGDEDSPPYHIYDIVYDNGVAVEFGDDPNAPFFNCLDYIVEFKIEKKDSLELNNDGDYSDTIRVNYNENHYNIFVDFFRKVNGQFEEVEMRAQPPGSANSITLCGGSSYDGRFPCLSSEDMPCAYIQNTKRPIKGVINYDMESNSFLPIFRTDTLMLKVRIQDRALNKSNEIETPEFTLQSIMNN